MRVLRHWILRYKKSARTHVPKFKLPSGDTFEYRGRLLGETILRMGVLGQYGCNSLADSLTYSRQHKKQKLLHRREIG